jgi:hypothetical protein
MAFRHHPAQTVLDFTSIKLSRHYTSMVISYKAALMQKKHALSCLNWSTLGIEDNDVGISCGVFTGVALTSIQQLILFSSSQTHRCTYMEEKISNNTQQAFNGAPDVVLSLIPSEEIMKSSSLSALGMILHNRTR